MKNKLAIILTFIISLLLVSNPSRAYDPKVHNRICETAVNSSGLDSVLKAVGIEEGIGAQITKDNNTQEVWKWIAYGGEREDDGKKGPNDFKRTRAFNHFHDPTKDWELAGLDSWINFLYEDNYGSSPVSSILWGLDPGAQNFPENTTGDWSWVKALDYYWSALTGLSNEMGSSRKRR